MELKPCIHKSFLLQLFSYYSFIRLRGYELFNITHYYFFQISEFHKIPFNKSKLKSKKVQPDYFLCKNLKEEYYECYKW
jgi:hypothetical protein